MTPLEMVGLAPLMDRTGGRPDVIVGLIDGPVFIDHPAFAGRIRRIAGAGDGSGAQATGAATLHGTFIAGMLSARRNAPAPAICPDCTLLVRSIFSDGAPHTAQTPSSTPGELAAAIRDCIEAGARCINLSLAMAPPSLAGEIELERVLTGAASRGVIVVAAAGNQRTLSSTAITRHPWVIPVVACEATGRPTADSNLGCSIGRQGLRAPGGPITSLGPADRPATLHGTSVAAPFVTGTVALLWSVFPDASAVQVKLAVTNGHAARRTTVVPPLLDAWSAYQVLARRMNREIVQ